MRIFKESQSVIKELNVVPHTKLYHGFRGLWWLEHHPSVIKYGNEHL